MSGFAIICDARAGESLGISTLALVDREKSNRLWWTSDSPHLAICYREKTAADFACRRLRKNRPRVVPFEAAARILNEQSDDIMHREALNDIDMGWDAHKGY